jgi:hypothetical protein
MPIEHEARGLDQVLVALRIVQPRDGPDRELARSNAERLSRGRHLRGVAHPAELFDWRAEIDDADLLGGHEARVAHEVRRAARHRERDVRVGLQQAVSHLLEPRRVGQVRVLVQDRRQAPDRPRQPAERRRAVAVQVQHVDLLPVDDLEQRGQRRRIELARSRYSMSTPSDSSVSSDRSFFRRLTSETLKRVLSKRGIIHANRRFTPCMRDPSQPR